ATGEPLKFYTADEWLTQWLEGKHKAKAGGTYLKYKHTIESFLASIGAKAKKNLNQITPREIQRFRDAELDAGKHANTCDWQLKHLRMPFKVAVRQGYITHNPAEAVELLNRRDAEGEKGTFDLRQMKALIKAAQGDWRGVILTAFYTGARLRDIVGLRWGSVDLEKRLISFTQGKTAKPVVIPIHRNLLNYLLELPASDSDRAFLFPKLAAMRTSGKSGLSMAFARIMDNAHIDRGIARNANGRGRKVHKLSFHSLRHSFNSILANAGVSQELRQQLTGHSSLEENKRYTHHEIATLRSAIEKIPRLNK